MSDVDAVGVPVDRDGEEIAPEGVYLADENVGVGVVLAATAGEKIPGYLVIKNGWGDKVHRIDHLAEYSPARPGGTPGEAEPGDDAPPLPAPDAAPESTEDDGEG